MHTCNVNQKCKNTKGSFECECTDGFQMTQSSGYCTGKSEDLRHFYHVSTIT